MICLIFVFWKSFSQHNQKEVAIRLKYAIEELEKEMKNKRK